MNIFYKPLKYFHHLSQTTIISVGTYYFSSKVKQEKVKKMKYSTGPGLYPALPQRVKTVLSQKCRTIYPKVQVSELVQVYSKIDTNVLARRIL